MKRYVILSTNDNPDYYHYLPYQEKAWANFGWDIAIMCTPDVDLWKIDTTRRETLLIQLPQVPEIRTQTLAQVGRLYAAHFLAGRNPEELMLMTCDMDLIPLSNYWNPDPKDITVYGHDLTWYKYFPMGYVAMTADKWIEKMQITADTKADILRDAHFTRLPFSEDWEKWWNHDWDLLTKRLMPFKDQIKFIDRGQINIAGATLAKGRVDRYNWKETQNQPDWIDAHCENNNTKHPDKLKDFLTVFEKAHGKL